MEKTRKAKNAQVGRVNKCNIEGCEKMIAGARICSMHRNRIARHGSPDDRPCRICGVLHTTQSEWGRCAGAGRKFVGTRKIEYNAWNSMKSRCYNEGGRGYDLWGGRGIKVCDRWLESFENFYADMGPRPPNTSLDRINNDGNYEPANCRWAACVVQSANRRTNRPVQHGGKMVLLTDLARETGIKYQTLYRRYHVYKFREDKLVRPTARREP